jgi:UDP-sugar transporter A1/2/3
MESSYLIRRVVLVALCVQNASYTLLRKYSAMTQVVNSREILLVGEIIKLFTSIYFISNSVETTSSKGKGTGKLIWLITNSYKMLVLSSIYLIMNVLSFVSLSYIGAGEFTVCAQLKILTTAAFSVSILGTSLSATKWRALAQLVVGCILVTSPSFDNSSTTQSDLYSKLSLGYGAVLLEVVLSGFASIYFEKVVKSSTEVITIWERNFQLSFYSIIIYVSILMYEMDSSYRIFKNWDSITVMVSLLGAAGGLLVAGTLKYADSIMKTLATAGAIIIATIVGYFFLGSKLDHIILLGAVTTIISIFNYTMDATSIGDSNISAKPDYAATNSIMSSPKNNSA